MPRKQDALAALYGDFSGQRAGALTAQAAETRERLQLQASTRSDMAGAPLNTYYVPQSYQQRVLLTWAAYGTDPLFGRLVNRFIEFSANGSQWEVPAESNENSWMKRLKRWTGNETRFEREEDVWNTWADNVNKGVPNVIPGLNEVVRWAVKHMLLSGMFIPHWKLGTIKVGKQTYIVPTQLTCYPGSSITLRRQQSMFMSEEIHLFKPVNQATTMQEGMFAEAPSFTSTGAGVANMVMLDPMNPRSRDGDTEAFALKYNWSPGDLVGIRRGNALATGTGVYPLPPFYSLLPQFAIRQKLFAADAGILDALINFIMMYKIGDKDHPPKAPQKTPAGVVTTEGTIETVRRLIQEGRSGPAMELFVPYYVNLEIKQPDVSALLSDTKYGSSATEIFQAFGIFFSRTTTGARERMEQINLNGFEEFIGAIRLQVKAFMHLLSSHIVDINEGKLKNVGQWSPNPLNTKSAAFIKELLELKDRGMMSAKTLFRYMGIDDDVEIRRIVQELAVDTDDVFNENVPLSYVQQVVQPDTGGEHPAPNQPAGGKPAAKPPKPGAPPAGGKTTTTGIPRTKQRGRPRRSPANE